MTMEWVNANWPLVIIGAVALLLILLFVFLARRKTRITLDDDGVRDVLDEGAAPAARNQALIDSPASTLSPAAALANKEAAASEPLVAERPSAQEAPTKTAPSAGQAAAGQAAAGDDLTRIKGVGNKLSAMLTELGITSFAQIADWTQADIDRIDPQLGRFAGRIERDQWVKQAKYLAKDDTVGFAKEFGRLE